MSLAGVAAALRDQSHLSVVICRLLIMFLAVYENSQINRTVLGMSQVVIVQDFALYCMLDDAVCESVTHTTKLAGLITSEQVSEYGRS